MQQQFTIYLVLTNTVRRTCSQTLLSFFFSKKLYWKVQLKKCAGSEYIARRATAVRSGYVRFAHSCVLTSNGAEPERTQGALVDHNPPGWYANFYALFFYRSPFDNGIDRNGHSSQFINQSPYLCAFVPSLEIYCFQCRCGIH